MCQRFPDPAFIRQAKVINRGVNRLLRQIFAHRAARTAGYGIFLQGHQPAVLSGQPPQQGLIKRFNKTHVDHRRIHPRSYRLGHFDHAAKGQQGQSLPLAAQLRLTDG